MVSKETPDIQNFSSRNTRFPATRLGGGTSPFNNAQAVPLLSVPRSRAHFVGHRIDGAVPCLVGTRWHEGSSKSDCSNRKPTYWSFRNQTSDSISLKNEHVPETLSLGKLDPGTLVSGSWASKEIKTRSYFWRTHKDKDSINIDKH